MQQLVSLQPETDPLWLETAQTLIHYSQPMKLTIGQSAPDFTLPDQDGKMHTLSAYHGQNVLLYFYPKDDTPGCTKEACNFRDSLPQLKQLNAVVFGMSTDSVASHKKFADKYGLPFTLLSDVDKKVVEAYGVWGEKSFLGKKYMGINRISFLIGTDGNILKIYESVKPAVHAGEVEQDLKNLA